MIAGFQSKNRMGLRAVVAFVVLIQAGGGLGQEVQVPPLLLERMSSESFQEREAAQGDVAAWVRKQPDKGLLALLKSSVESPDPEVRIRCLAVVKQVVIEKEYPSEGYLGIRMEDQKVGIPGEEEARQGLRIGGITPESAADASDLAEGDVIVALNGRIWKNAGMMAEFAAEVRKIPPGTEIQLEVLRNRQLMIIPVKLGERPIATDLSEGIDMKRLNREAKERFFQRWLDKQQSSKR